MMGLRRQPDRLVGSLEAMLYVFFFVVALAILAALFGLALHASHESTRLERAIELAGDAAARFAADPAGDQPIVSEDGLRVVCEADLDPQSFGWLYRGTVRVFDGKDVIYELVSFRYMSARGGAAW